MYDLRSRRHFITQAADGKLYYRDLKLSLDRIPVLENIKNHNQQFYVYGNKISLEKKKSKSFYRKTFFLFGISLIFFILLFSSTQDSWQMIGKRTNNAVHVFSRKLHYFNQITPRALYNLRNKLFGKSNFTVHEKKDGKTKKSRILQRKRGVCYNDIIEFIKPSFREPIIGNYYGEFENSSFIEQQCRILSIHPKLADFSQDSMNSSQILDYSTNYASYEAGAKILSTSSKPYVKYKIVSDLFRYILGDSTLIIDPVTICRFSTALCSYFVSSPTNLLQAWEKPGECWSFGGSKGRVQIALSDKIYITSVTLEHIHKDLVPPENWSSAPKKFSIVGIDDSEGGVFTARYFLGSYEYRLSKSNIQTFYLDSEYSAKPYKIIELDVESNHGHKNYTCIYRLRIHGHLY